MILRTGPRVQPAAKEREHAVLEVHRPLELPQGLSHVQVRLRLLQVLVPIHQPYVLKLLAVLLQVDASAAPEAVARDQRASAADGWGVG